MLSLLCAAGFFVGIHLFVAGTPARAAIIARVGASAYTVAFASASLGGLVWLVLAYRAASVSQANIMLYSPPPWIRHLGIPVVALAFLMVMIGLLTPNPTSYGQEDRLEREDEEPATGIVRVTRHPFLWGIAIWAVFHLSANGDAASTTLFVALLVLTIAGTASLDRKRRRACGDRWLRFAGATSNVPLWAILCGRNRLVLRELLDWRLAVAAAVFVASLMTHHLIIGRSPFPSGWVPF